GKGGEQTAGDFFYGDAQLIIQGAAANGIGAPDLGAANGRPDRDILSLVESEGLLPFGWDGKSDGDTIGGLPADIFNGQGYKMTGHGVGRLSLQSLDEIFYHIRFQRLGRSAFSGTLPGIDPADGGKDHQHGGVGIDGFHLPFGGAVFDDIGQP